MADIQTLITNEETLLKFLQSLMAGQGPAGPGSHKNKLLPPWCITGAASIFGLDWDGSDDEGDEDSHGVPLKGAWGEETHNKTLVACALPIKVVKAIFGTYAHKPNVTIEVYSQATEKTIKCEMCDLGPAARVRRPIDLTYGAHVALGHLEYGLKKYGSFERFPSAFPVTLWIEEPQTGEAIEIKGWDFQKGRVASFSRIDS